MVFEAEEKGDKAVDDEAEKMIAEAEDRVAKAWVPSDIKLEIVDGEKEGSRWLIVDDTHICYQNNVKGKKGENRRWKVDSIRWECSKRRHMGCPFQIFTSLPENGAPIKALSMKKPQVHTCSAEKLTPLMHKFRLKLASRMQDDLDLSWTKIWNEERQLLLEEVKDQPGLLQQVILEMGDAELFRRTGKFSSESKLFGGCHPCSRATSATLVTVPNEQVFFHLATLVHCSIETDQNLELHNISLFILECPSLLSVYCALPQSDILHISIYLPKLNFFIQKYFISFPSPSFSPP